MSIRIGTRRSDLALWQASHVARRLEEAGETTEIVELVTKGDRIDDVPLSKIEGKAFFTAEIEKALLEGRVDVAVHSHKDLPTEETPGLRIVAVPARGLLSERLLVAPDAHASDAPFLPLKRGARVGTSAPRRAEQLLTLRPDLEVLDLRGNVPTRVKRLREGRYDAIVLARAGLERLELDTADLVTVDLPTHRFVPAPAQGALAVQARADDVRVAEVCRRVLHDEETADVVRAERRLLGALGGGCSLPLGAIIQRCEDAPPKKREPRDRLRNGERRWCMRAFLGRDHPREGCPPRWAEARGRDPDAVAATVIAALETGEPTKTGPLDTLRVALTGSGRTRSRLAERLSVLGATIEFEIVLDFEDVPCPELPTALAALRSGDGLAVTSRQGARRLEGCQVPPGVQVGAVGVSTAIVLREVGIEPTFLGLDGARELGRTWPLEPGARVLFPCADRAAHELEEELGERRVDVRRLVVYRTLPREGVELSKDVDARVFMSPSAVEAALPWESARPRNLLRPCRRVAIGGTTAKALSDAGLSAYAPEKANPEEVVRLLATLESEATVETTS